MHSKMVNWINKGEIVNENKSVIQKKLPDKVVEWSIMPRKGSKQSHSAKETHYLHNILEYN